MKRVIFLIKLLAIVTIASAQVQIKPLPKPGFEQRIREYVDNMKVVDTHEHLMPLEILKQRYRCTVPDFALLLNVYSSEDIKSAGMSNADFDKLMSDGLPVREKWELLKPHWEASSNTGYNRGVLLAAEKLYGIKDINASTVESLSKKIREAYQNEHEWFYSIIKEKCNIDYVVLNPWYDISFFDPEIFKVSKFINHLVCFGSRQEISNMDKNIRTLDDLVVAVKKAFQSELTEGTVAVKFSMAYFRTLRFANVKKEDAEAAFSKMMNARENLSFNEVKPLQDYMMHEVLRMAQENHIPVQIHTGLQANTDDYNVIENANPVHLANLFQEFPDVKFILFHGGYPYGGELSTLAKNFRNVYIDLCWTYIISPSYSERYLNEWLETVPANKIMGFGGDYFNVEGVYSHLLFARQIVANVLINKVQDGYFTEDEAIKVAQMILHDNAVRILNLK